MNINGSIPAMPPSQATVKVDAGEKKSKCTAAKVVEVALCALAALVCTALVVGGVLALVGTFPISGAIALSAVIVGGVGLVAIAAIQIALHAHRAKQQKKGQTPNPPVNPPVNAPVNVPHTLVTPPVYVPSAPITPPNNSIYNNLPPAPGGPTPIPGPSTTPAPATTPAQTPPFAPTPATTPAQTPPLAPAPVTTPAQTPPLAQAPATTPSPAVSNPSVTVPAKSKLIGVIDETTANGGTANPLNPTQPTVLGSKTTVHKDVNAGSSDPVKPLDSYQAMKVLNTRVALEEAINAWTTPGAESGHQLQEAIDEAAWILHQISTEQVKKKSVVDLKKSLKKAKGLKASLAKSTATNHSTTQPKHKTPQVSHATLLKTCNETQQNLENAIRLASVNKLDEAVRPST